MADAWYGRVSLVSELFFWFIVDPTAEKADGSENVASWNVVGSSSSERKIGLYKAEDFLLR